MNHDCRILVADDEPVARETLAAWLKEDGYPVDQAASGAEAVALAAEHDYAICFLDLRMPSGPDGIVTMMEIRKLRPETLVVIVTAYAAVDTAVEAMKQGAEDYIVKPFDLKEISVFVEKVLRHREVRRENAYLRRRLSDQYRLEDLVSKNTRMHALFELVREVADLRSTVLLQGESGVGKELFARAIHSTGERSERPFVPVSCAALSESLLESELFGHERGAFTGAVSRKPGKFELAAGGTIFLDEIGEISSKLQKELLRVLEHRRFFRVGGVEEITVDARVIAATNRDLEAEVASGAFRQDLYYRLNVINLRIPPLRERMEDVPLLTAVFVEQLACELGRPVVGVSQGALNVLLSQSWPGNVRELRNAIERGLVTCHGSELTADDLGFLLQPAARREWAPPTHLSLGEIEREVIEAVLQRTDGNVREAARILGIDRSTLYDKIKRLRPA